MQQHIKGGLPEQRIKTELKDKAQDLDWTVRFYKVQDTKKNSDEGFNDVVKAPKRTLQPIGTVIKKIKVDFNIENKRERKDSLNSIHNTHGRIEIDKHRDNIIALVVNTNATPIRCVSGGMFCCCFCKFQFPKAGELKQHTLQEHDVKVKRNFFGPGNRKGLWDLLVKLDTTALKCNICDINLNNIDESLEHLKCHDLPVHVGISNRILPFKFDSELLRCAVCFEVFSAFKVLLDHMNGHFKNYICEICSAGFPLLKYLNRHRGTHKIGEFKCELCHKIFDTRQKREYHNKIVHLKVRHNKCGYCGESFRDNRVRNKHMEQEHGIKIKVVKCKACDRSFPNQSAVTIHLRKDHLMERRHVCSECGMGFFAKRALLKHTIKHTGLKEYLCEYCHKAFGRKHTLREHLRIHVEDKRFKCELCGRAFVQKCSWKSHMRCRHGEIV